MCSRGRDSEKYRIKEGGGANEGIRKSRSPFALATVSTACSSDPRYNKDLRGTLSDIGCWRCEAREIVASPEPDVAPRRNSTFLLWRVSCCRGSVQQVPATTVLMGPSPLVSQVNAREPNQMWTSDTGLRSALHTSLYSAWVLATPRPANANFDFAPLPSHIDPLTSRCFRGRRRSFNISYATSPL